MRALAEELSKMYDIKDMQGFVDRKQYEAAHSLSGALEVIQTIRDIADEMEADSREHVDSMVLEVS